MKKSMGFCASTAQMNIGRSQRHNHPLQKSFPAQRTDPIPTLRSKHFINLTNGVEALRVRGKISVSKTHEEMHRQQRSIKGEIRSVVNTSCGHSLLHVDRKKLKKTSKSMFTRTDRTR